jgi:hypothetical protein
MLNEQALYARLKKALPGYDAGGPVLADGPIFAHAGEYVLSRDMIDSGRGGSTVNVVMDGAIVASVVIDRMTGRMMQDRLWPVRS